MCVFLTNFNKEFTKLETYFKIEILVKSCSSHELSIDLQKEDCRTESQRSIKGTLSLQTRNA